MAERSLTALGSPPPVCLEILEAWREMRGTGQLCDLLLRDAPLSPEQLAWRRQCHERALENTRRLSSVSPALQRHPQFQQVRESRKRRVAEQLELERRVWALTLLEALPVALRQRLALSVLVNVARSWQIEGFGGLLAQEAGKNHVEAALAGLARPLLEQGALAWRRNARPGPVADTEVWLRVPEEEPACALWADRRGTHGALSLPLAWFTDVWARGLALVDGCFVLEVMQAPRRRGSLHVLALRWERRQGDVSRAVPMPAVAVRRGDAWFLRWW